MTVGCIGLGVASSEKNSAQVDGLVGRLSEIQAGNAGFAKGFLAACGRPCRITANYGGTLGDYQALADAIIVADRAVVIDGPCISACAMMADRARLKVSITNRSVFRFHHSSDEKEPPASPDVGG